MRKSKPKHPPIVAPVITRPFPDDVSTIEDISEPPSAEHREFMKLVSAEICGVAPPHECRCDISEQNFKCMRGYIYIMTNKANNKRYVGQARSHRLNAGKYRKFGWNKRVGEHFKEAADNRSTSVKLNRAIRKYGLEGFTSELLFDCDVKFLNHYERLFVSQYDSYNSGYNLTAGGGQCIEMTDEVRLKISNAGKLTFQKPGHREDHAKLLWMKHDGRRVEKLQPFDFGFDHVTMQDATELLIVALYASGVRVHVFRLEKTKFSDINLCLLRAKKLLQNFECPYTISFIKIDRADYDSIVVDDAFFVLPETKQSVKKVKAALRLPHHAVRRMKRLNEIADVIKFSFGPPATKKNPHVKGRVRSKDDPTTAIIFKFGGKDADELACHQEMATFIDVVCKEHNFKKERIEWNEDLRTHIEGMKESPLNAYL
jgi:hypothetical protein